MRLLTFLALLVATAAAATAQDAAFEPGYLVADGDTVRGEVAIGFESEATAGARFRPGPGASAREVTPDDASAFGTDAGRTYRRGRYETEGLASERRVRPQLRFARVALDGPAALLAYEPVENRPTFFLALDGELTGLYLVETEVETPRGVRRSVQARYRQALLVRLGACAPDGVDALDYTEADLSAAVAAYNACVDPSYRPPATTTRTARRTTARPAVALGFLAGDFSRTGDRGSGADDPAPTALTASVGAHVAPWFAPEALRVVVAARYEHDLLRYPRGFRPIREEQLNVLALDVGARFVVPVGGARVEVGGGLLAGRSIRWTSADEITPSEREGIYRQLRTNELASATGQYAELAVGMGPTEVAVRAQGMALASAPNLLPVLSTSPYAVRSVAVSLGRRF